MPGASTEVSKNGDDCRKSMARKSCWCRSHQVLKLWGASAKIRKWVLRCQWSDSVPMPSCKAHGTALGMNQWISGSTTQSMNQWLSEAMNRWFFHDRTILWVTEATKPWSSEAMIQSIKESNSQLLGGLEHFSIYWEWSSRVTNILQKGCNHQPVIDSIGHRWEDSVLQWFNESLWWINRISESRRQWILEPAVQRFSGSMKPWLGNE